MKTIILPGYSESNKDWAEDMVEKVDLKHQIIVHYWRHWTTDKSFSIKFEIEKILDEVGTEKFNVIAKSVGTKVALRLMVQYSNRINKVILNGIASTSDNMKKIMEKALPHFPTDKLLIIQNSNDPFASYSDVEKLVHLINKKVKIIEMPGTEHHYPYPNEFDKFLKAS